jgi:TonB family protein
MLRQLIILLLCITAGAASASAQDAEKALKEFEGKVLVLRHPLRGDSQQYDAEGHLLNDGAEESWTSHGGMLIDQIALTSDKLRLKGRRMLFLFTKQGLALLEFKDLNRPLVAPPLSLSLNVEVSLDHPIDSGEQAQKILSKVFALNTADLLASVPDFWRSCLTDRLTYDSSQKMEAEFSWRAPGKKPPFRVTPDISSDHGDAEVIEHVGNGVSAPRATYTPEPEYSEIARYEKIQGSVVVTLVVGKDGHVSNVRLVQPLGLGLDEASQYVKTWRFLPAERDKKPVAVEMNVEVGFNLY